MGVPLLWKLLKASNADQTQDQILSALELTMVSAALLFGWFFLSDCAVQVTSRWFPGSYDDLLNEVGFDDVDEDGDVIMLDFACDSDHQLHPERCTVGTPFVRHFSLFFFRF